MQIPTLYPDATNPEFAAPAIQQARRAAILNEIKGRPAFAMMDSELLTPDPAMRPQSMSAPQSIPGAAVLGTVAGDWAAMDPVKRDQIYQDQLDSAALLRQQQQQQQETERFLMAGLVPPKAAKVDAAAQPKFMNVSGALYKIDPITGESSMVVSAPPKTVTERQLPFSMFTESQKAEVPPGPDEIDIFQGVFNGENIYKRQTKRLEDPFIEDMREKKRLKSSGVTPQSLPATSRFKIVERK